ncbi:hypothetical protein [Thiocapsa rosea]|uniref:hypothetical protein n=1 Tax=Thiocapsa rosea TaxID=69360 RepID=UPI0011C47123|nr:hypothetical protein [Thiocapsa rosea]
MEVYQDWLRRTLILLNLAFPEIRESLQLADNCSGLHVLQSLGTNLEEVQASYSKPKDYFLELAANGIAFLNLSYHYIGEKIVLRDHRTILAEAYEFNRQILKQAERAILCGEASKQKWNAPLSSTQYIAIHPDIRNRNHPRRIDKWNAWWQPNAIKGKFPSLIIHRNG